MRSPPSRAHPRIRGEYLLMTSFSPLLPGSPPHTPGIPRSVGLVAVMRRLTPAYAGNTSGALVGLPQPSAHPRIRGEYCIMAAEPTDADGLTPAYAGNTLTCAFTSPPPILHTTCSGPTRPQRCDPPPLRSQGPRSAGPRRRQRLARSAPRFPRLPGDAA